jgi:hypothetical protein
MVIIKEVDKGNENNIQSKKVFVPYLDTEYINKTIEKNFEEFKKHFSFNPNIPPLIKEYISKQNDVIVSKISTSPASGNSVSNLSSLSDTSISSNVYGDLLMYNGSSWINVATSSLGISGSGTVTSIDTNNGLTGGIINTTGTIGLNVSGLSLNSLVSWVI